MITSTIEISFYACKNVCNMRMLFFGRGGRGANGGLDMGPRSGVIKVARDASCVPF